MAYMVAAAIAEQGEHQQHIEERRDAKESMQVEAQQRSAGGLVPGHGVAQGKCTDDEEQRNPGGSHVHGRQPAGRHR